MHRSKKTQRFLALIGLCVALLSSSACGGSDDDTTTTAGGATFAPNGSPPSGSISMQAGSQSGAAFQIRVSAKGISNVFGAAFHVTFNSNVMRFDSVDSSTSVLKSGSIQTQFSANPVLGHPSELAVVATRVQNAGGTVPSVDITQGDLIVLNFHAIAATSGTAVNFATPREACDETAGSCGPVSPVPTWVGGVLTAN